MSRPLILTLSVLIAGCGSDSPSEPLVDSGRTSTYESIAGTYVGTLVTSSEGITFTATLSLTLEQALGVLSGSFGLVGTLDDGAVQVGVQGAGTVTGTVDPNSNPSVSVTLTPGVCPNAAVTWSGALNSVTGLMTISGVANIFDSACEVFLTYEGTIVLNQ